MIHAHGVTIIHGDEVTAFIGATVIALLVLGVLFSVARRRRRSS